MTKGLPMKNFGNLLKTNNMKENTVKVYQIEYSKTASKDLKHLPRDIQTRIKDEIIKLSKDPYIKSSVKKLKNAGNLLRLRVGEYRIIYQISEFSSVIYISQVTHRKDAYK